MFIQNVDLICLFVLIFFHWVHLASCDVPNKTPKNRPPHPASVDYFNQTIQLGNESFIIQSASENAFKGDVQSLEYKRPKFRKHQFFGRLSDSPTYHLRFGHLIKDSDKSLPKKSSSNDSSNLSIEELQLHNFQISSSKQIKDTFQPIKRSFDLTESSTSLSVVQLHGDVELLPKPQARVLESPQHTRSRTGSTTVDLGVNAGAFNIPRMQFLNQTKPEAALSYVTSNQREISTARQPPIAKDANKITDLHIGALFPMTSSHSSGWLGGQGCRPASEFFKILIYLPRNS